MANLQPRRGRPIPEDERIDRDRDMEMEELRRTIKHLQRRLQQYEGRPPRRNQDSDDDSNINPFHNGDGSSEESDCPQRCRNQTRRHEGDEKVSILDFDGRAQGNAFLDWLITVERIFEFKDYSEERKVKLVLIKLKGYASLWWENLKREREREGRSRIRTWEKMKRELKKHFLANTYKQETYLKFHTFRQGEQNVKEYTQEFEYLMLKCDVREPEEQTIAHYLGGLKKAIADVIRLQPY